MGRRLAIIEDDFTQDLVENLTLPFSDETSARVWIAGKREATWEDWLNFDGSQFDGSVTDNFQSNCAKLYLDKHGTSEFRDTPCTDSTNQEALCQYPAPSEGGHSINESEGSNDTGCGVGGLRHNNTCYVTSQSPSGLNWFESMTYCHTSYGGSLAYQGLLSDVVKEWLLGVLSDRSGRYALDLAVGIRKKPWKWVAEEEVVDMTYFRWRAGDGDDIYTGRRDRCILLSPLDGALWVDVACGEPWNYFLCENYTIHATTEEATTTTISSTAATIEDKTKTTTTTTTTVRAPSSQTPRHSHVLMTTKYATPITSANDTGADAMEAKQETGSLNPDYILVIGLGVIVIITVIISVLSIHKCRCRRKLAIFDDNITEVHPPRHLADTGKNNDVMALKVTPTNGESLPDKGFPNDIGLPISRVNGDQNKAYDDVEEIVVENGIYVSL